MGEERALEMKRRHNLLSCLQDRQEMGLGMRWGVVIDVDTRRHELRATTSGGTTVVLTPPLLRALGEVDLYLGGRQPARIRELPSPADEYPCNFFLEDFPVPGLELAVYLPTGWMATGGMIEMTTTLSPAHLAEMPIVALTTQRPAGWPR